MKTFAHYSGKSNISRSDFNKFCCIQYYYILHFHPFLWAFLKRTFCLYVMTEQTLITFKTTRANSVGLASCLRIQPGHFNCVDIFLTRFCCSLFIPSPWRCKDETPVPLKGRLLLIMAAQLAPHLRCYWQAQKNTFQWFKNAVQSHLPFNPKTKWFKTL